MLPNDEVADESDLERPAWQWVVIGAAAIVVLWLPLAFGTASLGKRLLEGAAGRDDTSLVRTLALAGMNLVVFALAALAGGALVGRFGGKAGPREATFAGLVTAASAWAMIALPGAGLGFIAGALLLGLLALVGGVTARVGAALSGRRRGP
jgi:amino acid transporter